ncbi:TIGR00341 family protein [Salinimicrobium catena]|uniref:TIGR00341 family protein n=1 Tax=Salinimicrobium catena TaxID=390640 RepID=UPI002FE4E448
MLYLFHPPADLKIVQKEIIPLLGNREFELVSFPYTEQFEPQPDSILMLYLTDQDLREFLTVASQNQWPVGILPHPDNQYAAKGLGISGEMEEAVNNILQSVDAEPLDMLYCNGKPMFQSVNIGSIFLLKKEEHKNNFFSEIYNIFKNVRRAYFLKHSEFKISSDEEKVIHTSAMGIIVVEHSLNSLISKRLIQDTSINDGTFYAFILAPQNVLILFLFLIRSLWPKRKPISRLPSFIGSIKAPNLTITSETEFKYVVDGEEGKARELLIEVKSKALMLHQTSSYSGEKGGKSGKKSLNVEGLPTGQKRDELVKHRLPLLPRATTEEFEELFKVLRENARIKTAYMVMMILSTLIASFGLFADSSPVIIGAMILAPIIAPIVSFSMGIVRYDVSMLKTGFKTILLGTIVSLAFAAAVSLVIPLEILTSQIQARLSPTLLDMGIAVASGIAAAYAHAEEGIAKSLAGVAIAVALVPPLSVAGIGIGWWDWQVFSGAFLLYLTNLAGIILFAGLTFLLLGFAPFKRAKMGLVYTFIIVVLVAVPLSLSFNRIMKEAKITRALEGTTIDKVVLRDVKLRFGKTMIVSLKLVGTEPMKPEQIQAIKKKIEEKIEQPVILEVVSAIEF